MKIFFICGSLEPNRDGVGDYIRRLGTELIKSGHDVFALSMNDVHIKKEFLGKQTFEGLSLKIVRLPSIYNIKHRYNKTKEYLESFNPDFISLQFVPFSFHSKGLPFNFFYNFNKLRRSCKLEIMFHELWVGMAVGASYKKLLWGRLQKHLIKSLISKSKPNIIHTQSQLYLTQLRKLGYEPKILPLFSNIPVADLNRTKSNDLDRRAGGERIRLLVFGTIHPNSMVSTLAKEIKLYQENTNKSFSLTLLGRCGVEEEYWLDVFKSMNIPVERLGEQPIDRISQVLKTASIGISTGASVMIDKSGSVAAMLEHGLPVISIGEDWKPRNLAVQITPRPGIFYLNQGVIEACLAYKTSNDFRFTASTIANLFISSLLGHEKRMTTI